MCVWFALRVGGGRAPTLRDSTAAQLVEADSPRRRCVLCGCALANAAGACCCVGPGTRPHRTPHTAHRLHWLVRRRLRPRRSASCGVPHLQRRGRGGRGRVQCRLVAAARLGPSRRRTRPSPFRRRVAARAETAHPRGHRILRLSWPQRRRPGPRARTPERTARARRHGAGRRLHATTRRRDETTAARDETTLVLDATTLVLDATTLRLYAPTLSVFSLVLAVSPLQCVCAGQGSRRQCRSCCCQATSLVASGGGAVACSRSAVA